MLCWFGNFADCLKVRLHNNQAASRGNHILGSICLTWLCDKKFKSNHQMISTGAWRPGHETRNKAKGEYVFRFHARQVNFLFLPYINFHTKVELHCQALFQAFSASILNIEGKPKRYGRVLWCQVADDKDTLGEYLMKKLEWGPFLYLYVQSLDTRAFAKQVPEQRVQSVLTCYYMYFDSHC